MKHQFNLKSKAQRKGILILFLVLWGTTALFAQNYGDVNEDDSINMIDALCIAQYYVGKHVPNFNTDNAEVSGDGDITIVDALLVAQYYVRRIYIFPVEDPGTGDGEPVAEFTISDVQPHLNEQVYFDASPSVDSDGEIVSYEWDFDDGSTATGKRVNHAFHSDDQDYTVELTVTDNDGNSDGKKHRVFFTRPEGWTEDTHHKSTDGMYDVVFPTDKVNRLDITISPQNYQIMEEDLKQMTLINILNLPKPVYVPVTVKFNGYTWYHAGMRYKGKSTLVMPKQENCHKLPLHFNFDKFEDDYPEIEDQKFYGFKELIAGNNWYDSSFMRDYMTTKIFLDGDVVAARCAYYEIYIDSGQGSKYWGLYTVFEDHADEMLKTHFDDNDGNLYKPEFDGADWDHYNRDAFIKKTNEDAADYSDIQAAYYALHASRSNASAWRANLEEVFNVEAFIRYLAINTSLPNTDCYGITEQNYFLYQDLADNGRLVWIPWDFNLALDHTNPMYRALSLGLNEVSSSWPLIRYLMDDSVYRDMYHTEMRTAVEGCYNDDDVVDEIYRVYNMIRPYVDREVYGYTFLHSYEAVSFSQALTALVDHVHDRNQEIRNYLYSVGY